MEPRKKLEKSKKLFTINLFYKARVEIFWRRHSSKSKVEKFMSSENKKNNKKSSKKVSGPQNKAQEKSEGDGTFESFFRKHFQDLYKLALWLSKDPIETEDLVQETALRAFRSFGRFKKNAPFKPWIFTILTNVFIDNCRKKKKEGITTTFDGIEPSYEKEAPQHFSTDQVENFEDFVDDKIKQAIEEMPENYRIVFLLHTLGDLSYEEIAKTLACPLGTVMSRLYRARTLLKKVLKSYSCPE